MRRTTDDQEHGGRGGSELAHTQKMYTLGLTPSRSDFYNLLSHLSAAFTLMTLCRRFAAGWSKRIMGPIGMPEMLVILVIALVVFGPRKLPELGRSLGKSLNEFKKASNELRSTLEDEIRVEEQKDQRAKIEAEQTSAVAAAQASPASSPDARAPRRPPRTPPPSAAPAHRRKSTAHGTRALSPEGHQGRRSGTRLGRSRTGVRRRRQDVVSGASGRAPAAHHLVGRRRRASDSASPVFPRERTFGPFGSCGPWSFGLFKFVMGPMQALLPGRERRSPTSIRPRRSRSI